MLNNWLCDNKPSQENRFCDFSFVIFSLLIIMNLNQLAQTEYNYVVFMYDVLMQLNSLGVCVD